MLSPYRSQPTLLQGIQETAMNGAFTREHCGPYMPGFGSITRRECLAQQIRLYMYIKISFWTHTGRDEERRLNDSVSFALLLILLIASYFSIQPINKKSSVLPCGS